MTNPLLYDFKRTLKSKSVLVAMIIPILLSLAVIPAILGNSGGFISSNNNTEALAYYDNSGYHFLVFATNQYGQPISGEVAQFNLTDAQRVYSVSGTTNSSGLAFVTIHAPINNNYGGFAQITSSSGTTSEGQGFTFTRYSPSGPRNISSGEIVPILGQVFSPVVDNTNSSKRLLQVFYAGQDGTKPNYSIYYKVYNQSSPSGGGFPSNFSQTQMQFLGSLSDYHQTYSVSLPSNDTCAAKSQNSGSVRVVVNCDILVYFELFLQNGTLVETDFMSADNLIPPPASPIQTVDIASQFFVGVMGLFIPLIAIIGSYSSYGKDRVTGVLESVLSRPVTRKGLSISRYLSTFLALGIAISISIGVVDAILWHYGGSFLNTQLFSSSIAAFLVELAAFVGVMFLLSHLVRSSGLLIGIGIGLFIVLDFLWSVIIFGITYAVGATSGSAVSVQISIYSSFFNPAQFISLVFIYLTSTVSGFSSTQIQPALYGITIPSLVVTGVLWIAVPFLIFLFLATKRD